MIEKKIPIKVGNDLFFLIRARCTNILLFSITLRFAWAICNSDVTCNLITCPGTHTHTYGSKNAVAVDFRRDSHTIKIDVTYLDLKYQMEYSFLATLFDSV